MQTVLKNVKEHADNCIHLLHRRLGHPSFSIVAKRVACSEGLKINSCSCYFDCSVCKREKSRAAPVAKHSDRVTNRPFELCAADLVGPMPPSHGGDWYALMVVDYYTRFTFCFPLTSKNQTCPALTNWIKFVERRFAPYKLSMLQTDRGGEFCSARLTNWLQNKGIHHRLVNVATPSENGLIECKNQQVQTISRCLLRDSGLSKKYWAESFRTSVYLMNRLWNSAINMTPLQKLHNKRPCLKYLWLFGCNAWCHLPAKLRRKGQDRAR